MKLYVSFAKEPYKRDDILQKRPIILSILLTVATPYYELEKLKALRDCLVRKNPIDIDIRICTYIHTYIHTYIRNKRQMLGRYYELEKLTALRHYLVRKNPIDINIRICT